MSKATSQGSIQRKHVRNCLGCGYIIDGLPENRCPECARPFDPNDPMTYAEDGRRFQPLRSGRPYLYASVTGSLMFFYSFFTWFNPKWTRFDQILALIFLAGILVQPGVLVAGAFAAFGLRHRQCRRFRAAMWLASISLVVELLFLFILLVAIGLRALG
jgi:hypothetical protein